MWKDVHVILQALFMSENYIESASLWILLGAHLCFSLHLSAFFFNLVFLMPVNDNH